MYNVWMMDVQSWSDKYMVGISNSAPLHINHTEPFHTGYIRKGKYFTRSLSKTLKYCVPEEKNIQPKHC